MAGRKKLFKKVGGHPVLNNNNNNTIYVDTRNNLTSKNRNVKTKKRKTKEELTQSTNSYKIYCGVEYSSAQCLKRKKHSDYLFGVYYDPCFFVLNEEGCVTSDLQQSFAEKVVRQKVVQQKVAQQR